jgi:hypothetical protein
MVSNRLLKKLSVSAPVEAITIYYDSRQNLIAQGIIPRYARLPQPFPNGGFVPDPS